MSETIDVSRFAHITEYLNQAGTVLEHQHRETDSGDSFHWHEDGRRNRQCWSVADCDNDHLDADQYVAVRDTTDEFLYNLSQSNQTLFLLQAEMVVKTHEEKHIQHQTQRVGECALVRDFRDYECVYQDVDAIDVKTITTKQLKLTGVQFAAGEQQRFSIELFYDPNSMVVRVEGDLWALEGVLQMMG